ncbi:putative protein-like [Capsicum annuum]|nr:putative protein-like [Capsicum annuum]
MGDLIARRVLNISPNGLQGHIPSSIRSLSSVESLDLSGNHLVGEIPTRFASRTSLEVLNLSYNHYKGCIPQGNQFATFENNSYEGNDRLRGFSLSVVRGNDSISETNYTTFSLDDQERNSEFLNDFSKASLMGYMYQLMNSLMLNMGYMQFSFLLFLYFCLISFSSSIPHPCRKDQSVALLNFNKTLTVDPLLVILSYSYPTSSWNMSRDCCSWDGVICNEMTGHVIELNLGYGGLVGVINSTSSLFQLSHLQRLDLSMNNFSNSHISPEFDTFSSLTHLDLSWSYFSGLFGTISESIFHLPNLETLDLSENDQLNGYFPKTKWNSSASLMKLDLNYVNFSDNLPKSLGYLTSVYSLSLAYCNLRGRIPESLSNLTRIKSLYLQYNSLNGTIPSGCSIRMFSLLSLSHLDLRHNHFSGQLAYFKSNTILSKNQLQGHLPNSIQNLVNLTDLHLLSNNFSDNVDVSFFSDLRHLSYLDLSYNRISLTNENKVKCTLPGSLVSIRLAACGVRELEFLKSAKQLFYLDLSNNKIQEPLCKDLS